MGVLSHLSKFPKIEKDYSVYPSSDFDCETKQPLAFSLTYINCSMLNVEVYNFMVEVAADGDT